MKTHRFLLLALLACAPVLADSYLVTNPRLPYPPGCAQVPDPYQPGEFKTGTVPFFQEQVQLPSLQDGSLVPISLTAYRSACSEPNRSLIWLEFTLAEADANPGLKIEVPTVVAAIAPHTRFLMNLVTEPNGWGAGGWFGGERTYLVSDTPTISVDYVGVSGDRKWVFLLDNGPRVDEVGQLPGLTPSQYNAAFELVLRYNSYDFLSLHVPATPAPLPGSTASMPLSGRLSGNWVVQGAADQGILLAFSEMVSAAPLDEPYPTDLPMLVFLAHYTFDADGDMLWLTGSARFQPGATEVTIPIELVTGGEFRGGKRADREVIGSVTLKSRSCDDLGFGYDYSAIGLGSGQRRLERLFSMETAGNDCRDYEARVAANH